MQCGVRTARQRSRRGDLHVAIGTADWDSVAAGALAQLVRQPLLAQQGRHQLVHSLHDPKPIVIMSLFCSTVTFPVRSAQGKCKIEIGLL